VDHITGFLPGGWWDGSGHRHRAVEVRALSGHEEETLVRAAGADSPAAVTAVLSACLVRLGDRAPAGRDVVRALPVADRDYLTLLLRRVTFGDLVRVHVSCPWAGCAEPVTVDVSLADLPVAEAGIDGPVHTVRLSAAAGGPGEVDVRLPDGGDQEELTGLALRDPTAATAALLARVVRRIGTDVAPGPEAVAALTPRARAEVEAELERVAPAVGADVDVRCAGCGRGFVVPLDVRDCFFGELHAEQRLLHRDVHFLALHYHWSEAAILAMSRPRRQTYLDLLTEEIERRDDAG
jgi:hypothetical protein